MEFIVSERVFAGAYRVIQLPERKAIAFFPTHHEHSLAMAYDYCDFLNNKYCDKGINEEWPNPNNKQRIQFYINQILLLSKGNCHLSEDGDIVVEVD